LALVTGRATTGIKITPQAILRFVAPHGLARNLHEIWHGASVPSAVPNFRLGGGYLGFPAPKNEKLPKLPELVKSVEFMRVIGLQKLTFGAIRLVN